MTYGEHQEAASEALTRLLQEQTQSHHSDARWAMASREQMLLTLAERCVLLGAGRAPTPRQKTYSHCGVAERPLDQLMRVVHDFRRVHIAVAPSQVMRAETPGARGMRCLWQSAARSAFLATTELARSEQQPWVKDSRRAWPLIADLADVVEAMVILDLRLQAGWTTHLRDDRSAAVALLVAGDVGRIARLCGGDRSVDEATASPICATGRGGPAVTLVRSVADLPQAELHLAAIFHTWRPYRDPATPEERPGLRAARVVSTGQARLGLAAADLALRRGDGDLAARFMRQVNCFRRLHATSVRMVDTLPGRSTLGLVQQAEISSQLRRIGLEGMSALQLARLHEASRRVGVELGRSLRGELLAAPRIQQLVADTNGLPKPQPISSRTHPFYLACGALAGLPAIEVERRSASTGSRAGLRAALDHAPWPRTSHIGTTSTRL